MTHVNFRCASSLEECKSAFNLAKKIFKDDHSSTLKSLNWQYFGIDQPENIIIGHLGKNIIGVVRICPLKMKVRGKNLKVAGLSSICIHPKFQGHGFGRALMQKSTSYLDQIGYDLSFLIARRAADNFYTKFGYFGASSYQSINLRCKKQKLFDNTKLVFGEFNLKNSNNYLDFFQQSYENCFGACYRNADFWDRSIKKLPSMGLLFKEIIFNDKLMGYIVSNAEGIIECGFADKIDPSIIKQTLMRFSNDGESIRVFIPHDHKITKTLVGEDVEYFSRQCLYGGHMVRWSSLFNPIPICIGKFDKEKEPIFFNIPLLDQV